MRRLDAPHRFGTFAFSPDSRTLAVASYEKEKLPNAVIMLMELATGRRRGEFLLANDWPKVLAFSPDGRLMASGHGDTTAYLWDMTGRADPAVVADQPPSVKELADLWAALGSEDAAVAYRAVHSRELLPEQVRPERALETLERGCIPETKQLLEELSRGRADAWLTREAKTVLERGKAR